MGKSIAIAGASGLVGSLVLNRVLEDDRFASVTTLVRREVEQEHPKLKTVLCEFDRLEGVGVHLAVDCVCCCLGTTIKKAGSKPAFSKVDHDYPLRLAALAREAGVARFILISALGADASSRVFYNRIKGQVESSIEGLGFESFVSLRPSLLLGKRSERRVGEEFAKFLSPLLRLVLLGRFAKYRPIEASQVAKAMVEIALSQEKGLRYFENDELLALK